MGNVSGMKFCLLLLVGTVTAQTAPPYSSERLLPQWLTGIIAVSGFLLLTFIGFLMKKMWCEESRRSSSRVESVRENSYVDSNTYEVNLDTIRTRNGVESEKENNYESCDPYETSLDVRNHSRRNIYENVRTDRTEDKSTSM